MLFVYLQSVFSFRSYHRFRTLGPWRTAFFVFYIWLLGLLLFNIWFALKVHQELPVFLKSVPEVTFEKGVLTGPDHAISVTIPQADLSIVFDAQAKEPPTQEDFLNKRIMAFVTSNRVYMPSVSGVQSRTLPPLVNATLSQQWLQENEPTIRGTLQGAAFFGSAFALGLFLLFSFLLALSCVYLWSGWKRAKLSPADVLRWAALLQGPALTLWLVNLWWGVPLFLFGLFILYMIYIQQIFNLMPEKQR